MAKGIKLDTRGKVGVVMSEVLICTFCMDNSKSCKACDDGYEGE